MCYATFVFIFCKMIFVFPLVTDFYTLRKDVEIASARVEEIIASAGLNQLEHDIAHLESKATDTSFWDDRAKAQETLSALNDLKDRMRLLSEFKTMVMFSHTSSLFSYISRFMYDVELRFFALSIHVVTPKHI